MGTNISTEQRKDYKTLENVTDQIATHYILSADFKNLSKLYEEEYCNELVLLTRDIIDKNFNEMEVTYLAQRLKGKDVVNEEKTQDIIYTTKGRLVDRANESSKLRKKRICQGLSKFYVRIAHVFAAIVMTINPVYVYKDEAGNTIKTPLAQKDAIPKNARDRKISREGMCYNRINQLRHGQDFVNLPESGDMTLSPNICIEAPIPADEPGIPELEALYYDKYDYETGKFTGMKPETKNEYLRDVAKFYTAFTGKDPPEGALLQKFSDIKLSEYNKSRMCSSRNPMREKISGNIKDELFKKYANNVRDMIRKSRNVQNELLGIINQLFTYDANAEGKQIIRINPKLSESLLSEIVANTRSIIINYYLTCEQDYTQGVKLYESIVENQIKDTTLSQIESLADAKTSLLNSSNMA